MTHPYCSVWRVLLVTFVKIQQNPLSLVKVVHTAKGVLPTALCALQDSGTENVIMDPAMSRTVKTVLPQGYPAVSIIVSLFCVCLTTVVPTWTQTLCHARLKHMDQEEAWVAVNVQLDHIAPQLSSPLMSLALMEHTQTLRDKMHVSSVQMVLSALILLPLPCPVKMGPIALMAPHSALFALQGTGKSSDVI